MTTTPGQAPDNEASTPGRAQTVDAAALAEREAQWAAEEAAARGRIEDRGVDFAGGLSPAERAALAQGLSAHRDGPTEGRRER